MIAEVCGKKIGCGGSVPFHSKPRPYPGTLILRTLIILPPMISTLTISTRMVSARMINALSMRLSECLLT